jgi:hypothetical protein
MQLVPAGLAKARRNECGALRECRLLGERVIVLALLVVIGTVGSGVAQPTFTPIQPFTPIPTLPRSERCPALAINVGKEPSTGSDH